MFCRLAFESNGKITLQLINVHVTWKLAQELTCYQPDANRLCNKWIALFCRSPRPCFRTSSKALWMLDICLKLGQPELHWRYIYTDRDRLAQIVLKKLPETMIKRKAWCYLFFEQNSHIKHISSSAYEQRKFGIIELNKDLLRCSEKHQRIAISILEITSCYMKEQQTLRPFITTDNVKSRIYLVCIYCPYIFFTSIHT